MRILSQFVKFDLTNLMYLTPLLDLHMFLKNLDHMTLGHMSRVTRHGFNPAVGYPNPYPRL